MQPIITKSNIYAFVMGIIVLGLAYQIYTEYQLQKLYNQDHTTIVQIVDFINANIQKK